MSRPWAMVNDIHGFQGTLTGDDGVCFEWVIVHPQGLRDILSYEYVCYVGSSESKSARA